MAVKSELLNITRLAIPVALAQFLTAAAGLVDTLMAGRAGVPDLAGVALGSAWWLTLAIGAMGLFMAVNPIVSHYAGAGEYRRIPGFMHQAARAGVLVLLLLFVIMRLHVWYLPLMIDDPLVVRVTGGYLDGFSWGLPALIGTFVLRPYSEGLSFTRPHLVASLVSLLVNIPANYMLIFGHWGAPALGGAGAGWATALAFWAAFAVMALYTVKHPVYRKASIWRGLQPFDATELRHLLRVGLPVAMTLFVEVSIFSLIALFLGVRPSNEIAAHQIAMNVAYLAFTFPLSISIAATIRVGNLQGARDHNGAYLAARAALLLAVLAALFNISILLLFAEQIAGFYSNDGQVVAQAAGLLLFAALFQLADAFVVPAQGALRGYKDTRVPLLLAVLAYWIITLPLGYALGLTDILTPAMGAPGFWISLVVGLTISGIFMTSRLWHISQRHRLLVD